MEYWLKPVNVRWQGRKRVHGDDIHRLAVEFADCRRILQALGDANRQHLILEMLRMGRCGGVRVGEIAERTHLSRPAMRGLIQMLAHAKRIMEALPDRSREEE